MNEVYASSNKSIFFLLKIEFKTQSRKEVPLMLLPIMDVLRMSALGFGYYCIGRSERSNEG